MHPVETLSVDGEEWPLAYRQLVEAKVGAIDGESRVWIIGLNAFDRFRNDHEER